MLTELSRREKEANIKPDPDIDIYMKVKRRSFLFTDNSISYIWSLLIQSIVMQAASIEGQEESVVTEYIIKVNRLQICQN